MNKEIYITYYNSILGKLTIASDGENIIGLWIEGQKYFEDTIKNENIIKKDNLEIFVKTKDWLDRYFRGKRPDIKEIKLSPKGSEFRKNVWKILCKIPYGQTITYGKIAKEIATLMNKKSMSAQAVGNAVGHNPISIIIPCHRVIGENGSLIGYAGGIGKKIKLLELENVDIKNTL